MPTIKLTQIAVDRLRPTGKEVTYYDAQLPGFGLRISPKGRKTWTVRYRLIGGREVMTALGTLSIVPGVGDARELARDAMRKAAGGVDPRVEQRAAEEAARAQEAATAKTLAWILEHTDDKGRPKGFIEEYAKRRQSPATLYETRRLLRRVLPRLGDRPMEQLRRADIAEFLDEIAGKRLRERKGGKGGPLVEVRAIQVCLSTVFRWATEEGHIEVNPMLGIRRDRYGQSVARDRTLDDDEIRAFWAAMETIGWPFGMIGQLLLLLGQREGEVGGMRWKELDLTNRVWSLPGTRTKNKRAHIVHLASQAVEILQRLPRLEGEFVFSTTGTTAVSGYSNAKENADVYMREHLAKIGRELEHWTWHDLRRTVVTRMNEIGLVPHVIEAVVNHVSGHKAGVAGIYNRAIYAEQRRAALDAWGRFVEGLVRPGGGGNVVPIRKPA